MTNQLSDALSCFITVARFMGVIINGNVGDLLRSLDHNISTADNLVLLAKQNGIKARLSEIKRNNIKKLPLPCIINDKDGQFFILARLASTLDGGESDKALIHEPQQIRPRVIPIEELLERIQCGQVISLAVRGQDNKKFGVAWFIPVIMKYRSMLSQVLLAAFVIQLLALTTPLFFQIVTDKVLTHHSTSTLNVVAIGLLFCTLFDWLLNIARAYLFTHTTNRVDVELSSKLFRHLINLPYPYFQHRRIGDTVARVRELENLRSFLTNTGITTLLDVLFSAVFLAIMLYYSLQLSAIVFATIPAYAILSFGVTPVLRARLQTKFAANSESHSFLVESLNGVQTIKSMGAENLWCRKWDERLSSYILASFRAFVLGNFAGNTVSLISKLSTVAILYFGAKLVISGDMTVGALIAFNMFANHISSPIIRMAQIWTDFQQVQISMDRVRDIFDFPQEVQDAAQMSPKLTGAISFKNVSYRYSADLPDVIHDLSFSIPAGKIIGIVGKSGSGKSTLSKLMQKIYLPTEGTITIDGHNLNSVSASTIRRQISVVMQDSFLFAGTVRENIAIGDPAADIDRIIAVAKLAGAHEFICDLPGSYDAAIGENGTSLSGGQRQRLALARALFTNPRILIMDEATSSLDYESEHLIRNNLFEISKGRTVIIIAHRLTTVRDADKIFVLDKGNIVEAGHHEELLRTDGGHYAKLYSFQQA
jgi:subfamily B ATP-binding cassette protein HlyB/CyaB